MNLINRELNYMYREFGTPKIELYYLDYTHVTKDMYGDINGGTVYVRKTTDLLGTIKTDPELIEKIYTNLNLIDVKQKALFKVGSKELFKSGVLDEQGNWSTEDNKTTGVLEGFLNMFIRYKDEFYGIVQVQPALIYRGDVSGMYITTSKAYRIEDFAGRAKVVIGEPVVDRGEIIEVKSANPDPIYDWIDITTFSANTFTPQNPTQIYVGSLTTIPNIQAAKTVLVIGDKVYDIVSYEETNVKDYLLKLEENTTLVPSDIVTKEIEEPPVESDLTAYNEALARVNEVDYTVESWAEYMSVVSSNVVTVENTQEEVDLATANILTAQSHLVIYEEPPVVEELSLVTVGEYIYYNNRVVTLKDTYSEGRWRYNKQVIGDVSTALEVSISEIPTTFKEDERTILNVYSTDKDLFILPNEVLVDSTTKEITKQVVVVRDEPYVVISKTQVEDMYRFELAKTEYGTLTLADIPTPPVPDTTPPVITTSSNQYRAELGYGKVSNEGLIRALQVVVTDDSGEVIEPTIEGEYNNLVAGTYPITIVAVDSSGNRAEKVINVIVSDTKAPIVNGENAEVDLDSPVLDEEGIKALLNISVDELNDYTLEVTGTVDTAIAGSYTITVTATDSSGNVGTKDFTIEVKAPLPAFGRTYSNVGLTRGQLTNSTTYVSRKVNYVDVLADKTIEEYQEDKDPHHVIRLTKEQALDVMYIKENGELNITVPFANVNSKPYGIVSFRTSSSTNLTFLGVHDMFPIDNGELYELHLTELPLAYTGTQKFTGSRKDFALSNGWEFTD